MSTDSFYRDCLRNELDRRILKNPSYSLRSYARALDLEPGALSQFLSGKRAPSYKAALKILGALTLSPSEKNDFIASLAQHQRARGLKRMSPIFREQRIATPARELNADLFRVIGDWYHYAVLLLVETADFKESPRWIAAQLGISPMEASLALDRLQSIGLLKRVSGKLRFSDQMITTANKEITTPALRNRQKQILEKAIVSLENDPIEQRSMTGITMAIDPSKLPEAKKLISEFNRKMSDLLESGNKSDVYELQISLFPLQKRKRK